MILFIHMYVAINVHNTDIYTCTNHTYGETDKLPTPTTSSQLPCEYIIEAPIYTIF
jgi:hypothetical protein